MVKRWQLIHKRNLAAMEAEHTEGGRQMLEEERRTNPRFKGARIIEVIQAHPDQIKTGAVYVPEL